MSTPTLPAQQAEPETINGEAPNAHNILAALIDIHDDAETGHPDERCYVPEAWGEILREARRFLASGATQPSEPSDVCTDAQNCRRCKTPPKLRGSMEHAGIKNFGLATPPTVEPLTAPSGNALGALGAILHIAKGPSHTDNDLSYIAQIARAALAATAAPTARSVWTPEDFVEADKRVVEKSEWWTGEKTSAAAPTESEPRALTKEIREAIRTALRRAGASFSDSWETTESVMKNIDELLARAGVATQQPADGSKT